MSLGKELIPQRASKKVLSDPLSRYNAVIKCCNDPINREGQIFLKEVPQNIIYRFWFYLQSKLGILLFLFCFIPYFNILVLFMNCFVLVISELSVFIFSSNERKVSDPLKYMVYDPEICKQRNKNNLYFEITEEELGTFNFHKETISLLMERKKHDFKIWFMAYNDEFLAGYCGIIKSRFIILSHFFFCVLVVTNMHIFVFSDFLCFISIIADNLACY